MAAEAEQLAEMAPHPTDLADRARHAAYIQTRWRQLSVAFGILGPFNFLRSDNRPALFGDLIFAQNPLPVPFIVLRGNTQASTLSLFMERSWKLRRPEVLISVTGGAQSFALMPKLRHAFDRGLAEAVTACHAWVISGGTDTGVMELVGSALARYEVKQPLIGITPFGAVHGRDARGRVGRALRV
jgi:hypothetical protein